MMRAANRYYLAAAGLVVALTIALVAPAVWYTSHRQQLTQRAASDILLADAEHLPALVRKSPATASAVRRQLVRELDAAVSGDASELSKDAAAGRRANAAAALCLLEPPPDGRIWELLADAPDPRLRTALIHRLAAAGVAPQRLIQAYRSEPDPGIRQALLLTLGRSPLNRLPDSLRESFLPTLLADYCAAPDSGVHAAIHWLLRRWNQGPQLERLNRQLEAAGWNPANAWYHTPSGHLMLVIRGPVEFEMGSPDKELGHQPDEARKRVRIERTFAVAAIEVTEAQFHQAFGEAFTPRDPTHPDIAYPVNDIYWHDALWYCHQLTERDGLSESGAQLVYLPDQNADGSIVRRFFGRVKCEYAANSLDRTGYRLPTEAEWEYACRAGTTTSRFFGETDLYMGSYAWTYDDAVESTSPVAVLMPNRFGLFDILGNVSEWSHDVYGREGHDWQLIAFRGGSAWSSPTLVRSAIRFNKVYRQTNDRIGFRIARTLPSAPPATTPETKSATP